jgi:hypothetical protein
MAWPTRSLHAPGVGADVERVAAHEPGLDDADDLLGDAVGSRAGRAQEGVALNALVGADAQDPEGAPGARRAEGRRGGRPLVDDDADVADAHAINCRRAVTPRELALAPKAGAPG